jgi:hypothetical protein
MLAVAVGVLVEHLLVLLELLEDLVVVVLAVAVDQQYILV